MPIKTIERVQTEIPELPFVGPFGGIQSELSYDKIETFGFIEANNILFRKANARVRPGYISTDSLGVPPVGVADFYDSEMTKHSVAFTATDVYEMAYPAWNALTGGPLTGTNDDLMSWAVVNNLLLFSQGVDVVQAYDGLTNTYAAVSVDAVPAKYLLELATHLVVFNTIEGGDVKSQRVRWTAAGDPTDWTSFTAGATDLFNDLGPIFGCCKIQENGWIAQPNGWTRMIPTGIGLRPFDFVSFNDRTRGCWFPHSIASFGENGIAYAGRNDVFFFNGSTFQSIGARPVQDGRSKVGARSRIVSDLALVNPNSVFGYGGQAIAGEYAQLYWLIIPGISLWIYNFDEENWTRFTFDKNPKVIGNVTAGLGTRWLDLVGTWLDQTLRWIDFPETTFVDSPGIGFDDGTFGIPNFGMPCESSWLIASGNLVMGDRRHTKQITRFRFGYIDGQNCTLTLRLLNEKGQIQDIPFSVVGQNTGYSREIILAPNIEGMFLQWQVFGEAGNTIEMTEFSPYYVLGGEYKNN